MLLIGKLIVKCPVKKEEVVVSSRDGCAQCPSFKSVSYRGMEPLISCAEFSFKRR